MCDIVGPIKDARDISGNSGMFIILFLLEDSAASDGHAVLVIRL